MNGDLNRGLVGRVGMGLACGSKRDIVILKSFDFGGRCLSFFDPIVQCQNECSAKAELTVLFENGESGELVGYFLVIWEFIATDGANGG